MSTRGPASMSPISTTHPHHGDGNQLPALYHASSSSPDDSARKRRHRSRSSPDPSSARWSGSFLSASTSNNRSSFGEEAVSPLVPSPRTLSGGRPGLSPITSSETTTTGSSRHTGGGGGGSGEKGEDHLTVRRREANRLAAQRFRSRKKGYQDSLEEKVRQLEEDKDNLVRRLTETAGAPLPPRKKSFEARVDLLADDYRASVGRDHSPIHRGSNLLALATSPDRSVEPDIRIAALESANRRLQDELRTVSDENDKLRDELEQWRRWDREQREASWARENASRDTRSFPPHPPGDGGLAPRAPLPSYSSVGYPAPPIAAPPMAPTHAPPPRPPPVDTSPYHASQAFRLPPIRLPPIQTALSTDRSTTAGEPLQYLPRPAELDARAVLPLPTRLSVSPSDERRR